MPTIPLQFEIPKRLSVAKLLEKLSKKTTLQVVSQQFSQKTFYDSFDWRLYNTKLSCELNQSKTTTYASIFNYASGLLISRANLQEMPKFAQQFTEPSLQAVLQPVLEMRALLTISTLPYQLYHVNILNKDQKITLRLSIEEHEVVSNRVILEPLKGYQKSAVRISEILEQSLHLQASQQCILQESLKLQARKPDNYSAKLNLALSPKMRSDTAGKYIFKHLLAIIKNNETGTIEDIDSEFLHDFRVAVRKTRSGLSQLKYIFPSDVTVFYADYFSWLGKITSETRDMDVYLLNFEQYKNSLPISIRDDLNPLYAYIVIKQQKAQQQLATKLKSTHYLSPLADWEQFLNQPPAKKPPERNASLPIQQLAQQRIWKTYLRVMNEGSAITDDSPAEALHDLRKTCKKLRNLMEFFQSLYPEKQIKPLIKTLKGFQEVLGDFQDYEVQEISLKKFSEDMMRNNTAVNTFLAMGVLVQNLETRRIQARNDFAARFTDFKQAHNQHAFKSLFATKRPKP